MTWRFNTTPEEMKQERLKAQRHSEQVSGLQKKLDRLQRKVDVLRRYADEGQSVWEILRSDFPDVYIAVQEELRLEKVRKMKLEVDWFNAARNQLQEGEE